MKSFLLPALLTLALAALPAGAQPQPQPATTGKSVNLRAGPARDFPVVAVLPAGLPVSVQGCLPDYTWCDVVAGYQRGWAYARNLNYFYQGRHAPLPNYAPLIGVVVLSFVLHDYWDHYYIDRPWYRDRHRWENRPYPPPPPPPHVRPRPVQPSVLPAPLPPPAHARPRPEQPSVMPAPVPPHVRPRPVQPSVMPAPAPRPVPAPAPRNREDRRDYGERHDRQQDKR